MWKRNSSSIYCCLKKLIFEKPNVGNKMTRCFSICKNKKRCKNSVCLRSKKYCHCHYKKHNNRTKKCKEKRNKWKEGTRDFFKSNRMMSRNELCQIPHFKKMIEDEERREREFGFGLTEQDSGLSWQDLVCLFHRSRMNKI